MKFIPTALHGVWIIEPQRFGDSRGYFMESFRADVFRQHVGPVEFIQDNESESGHGVLRGLHYQRGEASQAKLVRVSRGEVLDVAVDLRRSSPTFMQHIAVTLSQENGRQLFVPRGFAHGFLVTGEMAQFQYKVDNVYCPDSEVSIRYDDPRLAIKWPQLAAAFVVSDKDRRGLNFEDAPLFQ